MRKLLLCFAVLFFAANVFAQKADTNKMKSSGQSADSDKARYVLGLVRNNDAARLDAFIAQEPWTIQSDINVYKDADKKFTISIFCVAVDLGYLDIVKTFVKYGYAKNDFCRVQTFTEKKVVTSRAEMSISASSGSSSSASSWMGRAGGSSSSSASGHMYFETYDYKTVTKTYFASPLDYATGAMFDYLWAKGFRSDNLFTKAALLDAKKQKRTEVWKYIMDNKPEALGDKPVIITEEQYKALQKTARNNPNSLAEEVLENNKNFTEVKSEKQAAAKREELKALLDKHLKNGKAVAKSDTLGYAKIEQYYSGKEEQYRLEREEKAEKAEQERIRMEQLAQQATYRLQSREIAIKNHKAYVRSLERDGYISNNPQETAKRMGLPVRSLDQYSVIDVFANCRYFGYHLNNVHGRSNLPRRDKYTYMEYENVNYMMCYARKNAIYREEADCDIRLSNGDIKTIHVADYHVHEACKIEKPAPEFKDYDEKLAEPTCVDPVKVY